MPLDSYLAMKGIRSPADYTDFCEDERLDREGAEQADREKRVTRARTTT
jgi:hypothetical protein